MLQVPVTTLPAQSGALSPQSSVSPTPGATVRVADGTADQGSLIERLLARAQDVQDTSAQQLSQHLDQLDAGRISTSDMLRLQADMGAFSVRVQITVRVADETGRAIQTLSQRS
ncbi:MAG TPA: acyl carrier protein [Paraburkholderia sp.]|jgi:hypothetical protein|nr:acyl carrier protein [Paraburkholderia sp.]